MKKLLLISALALCAAGTMAQTPLLLADQGDSGSNDSWSWGVTVIYPSAPSSLSMIATADWGKLNIASGITEINTIVVDVAEISGEWKLCDDQTKLYSDLLKVGKNTINFSSTAKEAILMAVSKGNTITLNSVTIDGTQTTYAKMYNIGFYNMDLKVISEWGARYIGGANSLGDRDAVITIELNSAVEEGDFQLVVKYNDDTESYKPFSGTGGSIEVGNNIKEARIMACKGTVGKTISIKSVTISHSTALRPISSDTEVVNTTYYNLAGVKATTPQKGLNIVVRTLSDGSKVTEKLLVK